MKDQFQVDISEEILQNIYTNGYKNYSWHEMPDDGGWDLWDKFRLYLKNLLIIAINKI